ncbi:MAG: HDOD domain-containing protein [Pseudomonadota bacterium]
MKNSHSALSVYPLPTLLCIKNEIRKIVEGKKSSFQSIEELVRLDPVMSFNLLCYAGSVADNVGTVETALSVLGPEKSKEILLSMPVLENFPQISAKKSHLCKKFWIHSFGVACTVNELSNRFAPDYVNETYVAGLLHDLGKFVLFLQSQETFETICKEIGEQGLLNIYGDYPLLSEERKLGFSHVEMGRELGELGKLPRQLIEAMWLHHQPVCEPVLITNDHFPQLVRFADVLCTTHHVGSSYFLSQNDVCHESYHYVLEELQHLYSFSYENIVDLMDSVIKKTNQLEQFFEDSKERKHDKKDAGDEVDAYQFAPVTGHDGEIPNRIDLDTAGKLAREARTYENYNRQLFTARRLASMGHFAAGLAFEINNPLTIISMNLQILKRILDSDEVNKAELEKRHQVIAQQEKRMVDVIDNVMSFAQPAEPKFSVVDIVEVVKNALVHLEERESLADINFIDDFPENLQKIIVDREQIEKAFKSILLNACQAMPAGGTLLIKVEDCKDFVTTAISDTGEGIRKRDLGKIFDPFFTTKMQGEGTGIGLAACHQIVVNNRGKIWVSSEEGRGSTFTIALPCDKSRAGLE